MHSVLYLGALRVLLVICMVLFVAGIFSPLLTVEKFVFLENTFTLVSAIADLFREGRVFLATLIAAFSLGLPVFKFVILYRALWEPQRPGLNRYLRWVHAYGRWSMLDVFVVALLVVALKLGVLFEVQIHIGLYLFAASVLLTMVLTALVARIAGQRQVQ